MSGGKMSGWQNIWVSKSLAVKMSGCENVGCQMLGCQHVGFQNVGEPQVGAFFLVYDNFFTRDVN